MRKRPRQSSGCNGLFAPRKLELKAALALPKRTQRRRRYKARKVHPQRYGYGE